ncbi:sugar phosphate isomerase/epimerase family protein [Rugosimonospora africana]|uniref:Xylose isomerase n=1 Tax=Rugosimonospora africana TaxID=556532 RepID=A0A8J3VRT9_9ACTN|nr:sugar phosphate isomerase/epimerase [Rugosimonospora africana]GIH16585.1 xylose isomerase [Rugosimonospora africana]
MPLRSVSLQLYSVRQAIEHDLAGTLARVAEIGYQQVESSYRLYSRGPQFIDALRAHSLASPTMTSPLVDVDLHAVFAAANEIGAHTVVETFVPEQFWTSVDDAVRVAEHLNVAAQVAAGYGLRVGYHNHWWELERLFDGRTALETMVDRLRPEVVLEVDAYWAAVGGQDVAALLSRLSDRVRFLHLKDGPIDRENLRQLPAGQGKLPIPEILDAVPDLEVGVVEFDEYAGDIFQAVDASLRYLRPLVTP